MFCRLLFSLFVHTGITAVGSSALVSLQPTSITAIHPHLHRNHTQMHYYCINSRSHSHCCIIAACVGSCHQVLINWSLAQMSAHVVDNPSIVTAACDCFQQSHNVNLQLKSVLWLSFQNGDDWLQFVIVYCCSMTDEDIITYQCCSPHLACTSWTASWAASWWKENKTRQNSILRLLGRALPLFTIIFTQPI